MKWLPFFILAGGLAVAFYRVLLGEVFFWGLPALQFVPWREYALDQLASGVLPLWNPLNGGGAPLFANYQSALLYPPSWLTLISLVAPVSTAWIMSVTAIAHLFIGGWGMWRLTGRMGVSDVGGGVSMLAFGMTLYLVARLGTFPIISAAAWLPWIVWAALGVTENGRVRDVGYTAGFSALILLAGHAQTAWYSLLLVGLFVLWKLTQRSKDKDLTQGRKGAKTQGDEKKEGQRKVSGKFVRAAGVFAAMALGAGVAAVQLAATAELLGQSQRSSGADYTFAVNFSYAPARILNILSPNIFGTPADGSYYTTGAYFEDAVYIGLLPLIGALAAVIAWVRGLIRRRDDPLLRVVPFLLILIVVALVLAWGNYTPIFRFLYDNVPTFDLFQAPVRWHLWTAFGLSLLAGIGVSAWGRDKLTRRISRYGMVAGIGGAIAALIVLATGANTAVIQTLLRAVLFMSVLGAAAAWLSLRQPDSANVKEYRGWAALVLIVVAGDLVIAGWGLNPTIPASFYAPGESFGGGRIYYPTDFEESERYTRWFRFNDYRQAAENLQGVRETGLANLNLLDNVSVFNNFDPLLPAHYARYRTTLDEASAATPPVSASGLQQASHTYPVITLEGMASPVQLNGRAWQLSGNICWHENEDDLWAAMMHERWSAFTTAHILGDGGCDAVEPQSVQPVIVTDHSGNRLTLEVNADRLNWLIVADTDYPGWNAVVDNVQTPIFRANGMFRAVQVDAGTHTVEFLYRPSWAAPGLLISVLSAILVVALLRTRRIVN